MGRGLCRRQYKHAWLHGTDVSFCGDFPNTGSRGKLLFDAHEEALNDAGYHKNQQDGHSGGNVVVDLQAVGEHIFHAAGVQFLADLMEELGLEYVLLSGDQLAAVQQSALFVAVTQTETAGIYRAVQP